MYNRILQGLTTEEDAEEFLKMQEPYKLLEENKHLKRTLFIVFVSLFVLLVCILAYAIAF